ncbi:type I glutamate--ammonia ligase [Castellaniella sp.]|uniref:type I glutamate--ammonia ligase n=1 Tax=Castellaniella sp. TaxID=1955812 RepID=UPI00355D6C21
MSDSRTLDLIQQHDAQWVDLRFTDTHGKAHHITYPAATFDATALHEGRMFDGSSIQGWKSVHESDMLLMPDDATAVVDPFAAAATVMVTCTVQDPATLQGYERDPRSIALRAETFLQACAVADAALFGPEPEFFVFDGVRWQTDMQAALYEIVSSEGAWMSAASDSPNHGHRPHVKGGYFPVPPMDSLRDLRGAMCDAMAAMGLEVEVHHHEVATAGQCEIGVRANTLTRKADEVQILKYCVHSAAHACGKTATFMPKPLLGDNGSGMHVHQSLVKDGVNLFAGNAYAGLSEMALHYLGGIIRHAQALNAFTNPTTNSYKRLVPGFEAPVMLAYSARNRSASIRIPLVGSPSARRIEARFPDPACNPYLGFAALLMAGLDGILNKIDPGDAMDKNLYDLPIEEAQGVPCVATSLAQALDRLEQDHDFLTQGGVFSEDMLAAYAALKREQVQRVAMAPCPVEFDLYYSV